MTSQRVEKPLSEEGGDSVAGCVFLKRIGGKRDFGLFHVPIKEI